jgi:hypothetical protein
MTHQINRTIEEEHLRALTTEAAGELNVLGLCFVCKQSILGGGEKITTYEW